MLRIKEIHLNFLGHRKWKNDLENWLLGEHIESKQSGQLPVSVCKYMVERDRMFGKMRNASKGNKEKGNHEEPSSPKSSRDTTYRRRYIHTFSSLFIPTLFVIDFFSI